MAEREKDRVVGRRGIAGAGEKLLFPRRQALETSLVGAFVGQVARPAREGVDGRQIVPERTGQQPGADGEVLVVCAREARAVRVGRGQASGVEARDRGRCNADAHAASAPGRPYSRR